MRTNRGLVLIVFAASAALAFLAGGCWHVGPIPDGSNAPSDTDTDPESCTSGGGWYDTATDLCWQNPPADSGMVQDEAIAYCDNLDLDGRNDWRLPMIQELISLLRGCVDGLATGDLGASTCGVNDPDCLYDSCYNSLQCSGCSQFEGPDDDPEDCYWVPSLVGTCGFYMSSSSVIDSEDEVCCVGFHLGCPAYGSEDVQGHVRCVRGGP